jgi:hypothetical protein
MLRNGNFEMHTCWVVCVQEFAEDKPYVSIVISMLKSETLDLPQPKQPAFIERRITPDAGPSQRIKIPSNWGEI